MQSSVIESPRETREKKSFDWGEFDLRCAIKTGYQSCLLCI